MKLNITVNHHYHYGCSAEVLQLLKELKMDNVEFKAELAAQTTKLNDLTTQVTKIAGESQTLLDKIAALQATIDANAGNVPDDVLAAFEELKTAGTNLQAATQAADDKVKDA